MNLILFLLDYTIFIPITIIRLILIYLYGSKYGIEGMDFLDVMSHADNKYFNQTEEEFKIDTLKDDFRYVVYNSSKLSKNQVAYEINDKIENNTNNSTIDEVKEKPENITSKIKSIYEMLIEENNQRSVSDDLDEGMPDVTEISDNSGIRDKKDE